MIFLTSTSDKIQIITSAISEIDIHASWIDLASGTVTPGRTNTKISTATTTDVIAAPAASTVRNVKTLKVGNNHATATCVVTIQHTDGTNVIVLEQVTLAAGERIGYEEGIGIRYFDSLGREKTNAATISPSGNTSTADIVASAADTYLTGSQLAVGGRLAIGASFHWTFRATKTAAGTATPIINIRTGTAGTTADTARCVHTGVAQTAATDTGWFEIEAGFRAIGGSAVLQSVLRMDHTSADAAGLGTYRYVQVLSSAFDATPAGTIIGLSVNPGASGVWTVQFVKLASDGLIN